MVFFIALTVLGDALFMGLASTSEFGSGGALEVWDLVKATMIVAVLGATALRTKSAGAAIFGLSLGLMSIAPWLEWHSALFEPWANTVDLSFLESLLHVPPQAWAQLVAVVIVAIDAWLLGLLLSRPSGLLKRPRWVFLAATLLFIELFALQLVAMSRAEGPSPVNVVAYRLLVSLALAYVVGLFVASMRRPMPTRR